MKVSWTGLMCAGILLGLTFACSGGQQTSTQQVPVVTPTPTPLATPTPQIIPTADHVFLVVLENHGFSEVIGNSVMPYLNLLAAENALATQYFANTHPSIGNYFMLTAGNIETNDDAFAGTVTDDNLVRALSGAGKTWKAYIEDLPLQGYLGTNVFPYLKQHDPFAYLSDVINAIAESNNIVPFEQLSADLSSGAVPQFVFLSPNATNDGHACPANSNVCPDSVRLEAADHWLRANLDPLIKNPAFGNSVFIVVFDEAAANDSTNGGGRVAAILLGAHVKTAFASTTFYQHQSTLRLILELLSVKDLPGNSATAADMTEFFH